MVNIAGTRVKPGYADPAPGIPGLDQVNVQLPSTLPDDCYVPVSVEIGGLPGRALGLSIANTADTCAHRMGLTAEQMRALDDGTGLYAVSASINSALTPNAAGLYQ